MPSVRVVKVRGLATPIFSRESQTANDQSAFHSRKIKMVGAKNFEMAQIMTQT
jgi:hypothetical protein